MALALSPQLAAVPTALVLASQSSCLTLSFVPGILPRIGQNVLRVVLSAGADVASRARASWIPDQWVLGTNSHSGNHGWPLAESLLCARFCVHGLTFPLL